MDFKKAFSNIGRVQHPEASMSTIDISELESRDPDKVTNKILDFLTKQSENAEQQFKTSRNLIIATIVIMVLQIGQSVWSNSESNSKQKSLTKIIELQSQQSETISRMSLNLLDLQSQTLILEQENARLNQKILKLSKLKK